MAQLAEGGAPTSVAQVADQDDSPNDIPRAVDQVSLAVPEVYSERFALSMSREPVDALIGKMVGRKITVQYDPANPGVCFLPGEKIEGCKIEQSIGSQVHFYPKSTWR